jgi:hypothetical protein
MPMAKKNSDAEEIFNKNQDEMTDIEKMMAEILNEYGSEAQAEKTEEDLKPVYASPAPPAKRKNRATPETDSKVQQVKRMRAESREINTSYVKNSREEREKNIREASKKRSSAPLVVILILILALVVGALVYPKMFEDLRAQNATRAAQSVSAQGNELEDGTDATEVPIVSFPPDMIFPTPEQEDAVEAGTIKIQPPAGSIVIMSDTKKETEAEIESEPQEHSYSFHVEDISWTGAQAKCRDLGGHLVVISDEEELNTVITLAQQNGIEKVWIGCHREYDEQRNERLIWENNETVNFYAWGRGEPSFYDSGDRVAEDYLLLWNFNGAWVYNDSRNDPVRDYPAMYSGKIGYVCEIG